MHLGALRSRSLLRARNEFNKMMMMILPAVAVVTGENCSENSSSDLFFAQKAGATYYKQASNCYILPLHYFLSCKKICQPPSVLLKCLPLQYFAAHWDKF